MRYLVIFTAFCLATVQAQAGKIDPNLPTISYVQFQSFDIVTPGNKLSIGGQLRIPANDGEPLPAVVILHGSAGVDSRGALYARSLNDAGIATLEIDMWGARGIAGGGQRPPLPTFTLPDAFGALDYLASTPAIDAQRIGVLGFSWGGVMSLLSADQSHTDNLGNGHQFAAHVAHYPVCWGYNIGIPGIVFNDLTGAPVLIQVGSLDDYDEGAGPCQNLAAPFPEVSVRAYPNAHHAWDRLQPPLTVQDPFSHLGAGGEVNIIPNPGKAQQSSKAAVALFRAAFGL
ncbi:MAG: dienelactone hydrolase family protein [Thiohalobacterales bacterium]|nr:dienelactone hydrolase family protein [Thiohalobacterales bacterium]